MSGKTIYTEITTDMETGEVKKVRKITKKASSTEQFMKLYIEDIGALMNCSNTEKNIVFAMIKLRYVDYCTNELFINADRREKIAKEAGINVRSVHNSFYRLVKKEIIQRIGRAYVLNPKIIFSGSDIEREKVFQLQINYQIK